MSASASFIALTCLLLAVMGLFSATPAIAAEPSFDKVIAGNDARALRNGVGVTSTARASTLTWIAPSGCIAGPRPRAAPRLTYHLGWIYAIGRGGERNDELAAAWFYKAAQQKDPHARRMLKRLGYRGKPKRRGGLPARRRRAGGRKRAGGDG